MRIENRLSTKIGRISSYLDSASLVVSNGYALRGTARSEGAVSPATGGAAPFARRDALEGSAAASAMGGDDLVGSGVASAMGVDDLAGSGVASVMDVDDLAGSGAASVMGVDDLAGS